MWRAAESGQHAADGGLCRGVYGRAGYGASAFYVFTTIVHTGLLGAAFALTPTPIYPVYANRTADPVADQQLAGLVMWVPAGAILTVTGVALFAAWLGEAERRELRTPRPSLREHVITPRRLSQEAFTHHRAEQVNADRLVKAEESGRLSQRET